MKIDEPRNFRSLILYATTISLFIVFEGSSLADEQDKSTGSSEPTATTSGTSRTRQQLSKINLKMRDNRLSGVEKSELDELWLRAIKSSPLLDKLATKFPKQPKDDIADECYRVFDCEILGNHRPMGWALTNPDLEPSYPVPGGQKPAYLLFRSSNRFTTTGASIGDGANLLKHLSLRGAIENVLDQVISAYRLYKQDLLDPSNGEQLMKYRKELIDLVGEDAFSTLKTQSK